MKQPPKTNNSMDEKILTTIDRMHAIKELFHQLTRSDEEKKVLMDRKERSVQHV